MLIFSLQLLTCTQQKTLIVLSVKTDAPICFPPTKAKLFNSKQVANNPQK